ncbi:MAG: DUF3875 domain-containing protein [Prevotellaceae bacterium]|nr:DUF3875 domain-containing protein [Prevotellaceae bacterium]
MAVENSCIVSKDADITVAFRVELPELFTVTNYSVACTSLVAHLRDKQHVSNIFRTNIKAETNKDKAETI